MPQPPPIEAVNQAAEEKQKTEVRDVSPILRCASHGRRC